MNRLMIVKRTNFEVFVAECEACAFSAISRFEADAVAILERHQARCAKFLEQREKRVKNERETDSSPAKQPIATAIGRTK